MARKKPVQRAAATRPLSPQEEDQPDNPTPAVQQQQPPPLAVQQQQPPPSVIPTGAVILLDSLADFLRRSNPAVDWTTTLAVLTQIGGTFPAVSPPPSNIPTTKPSEIPTETEPSTSTKPSEIPTATEPSTEPSSTQTQTKPLDVSPLSAYQDPNAREESEKEETSEEQGNGEKGNEDEGNEKEKETEDEGGEKEGGKTEETPAGGTATGRDTFEGVDLNETAKK